MLTPWDRRNAIVRPWGMYIDVVLIGAFGLIASVRPSATGMFCLSFAAARLIRLITM